MPASAEPVQDLTCTDSQVALAGRLSDLHRAVFDRGWEPEAFLAWLREPDTIVLTDPDLLQPPPPLSAMVVARLLPDEAEILTIAVHPGNQRQGRATRLLGKLLETCRKAAVGRILLEVDETNVAARALYARHGFAVVGRRRRYYRANRHQTPRDALVLALTLDICDPTQR